MKTTPAYDAARKAAIDVAREARDAAYDAALAPFQPAKRETVCPTCHNGARPMPCPTCAKPKETV